MKSEEEFLASASDESLVYESEAMYRSISKRLDDVMNITSDETSDEGSDK